MEREITTLRAHGMKWLSLRGFAPTIERVDLERLRHPERLSPRELVKDNTVRTVARLPDPDRPEGTGLYVKRYKLRDLTDRLRGSVIPGKAVREWRICRALQRAAVPTCDVLAVAVRRRSLLPREGFLLSREVTGSRPLGDFLEEVLPELPRRRPNYWRRLVEEGAALTAQLARAGFYHSDYHAGNLLVRPEAAPGQRLYVVDLHSMWRRRRARRRALRRMLAMLGLSVRDRGVGPLSQVRFLRRFLRRWQGGPDGAAAELRQWMARLQRTAARLREGHLRSRTRRCLKESSLFTSEKTADFLLHRRRDFPLEAALDAVRKHAETMSAPQREGLLLRDGHRTQVTVVPCESVPERTLNKPVPAGRAGPGQVCVKSFLRRRPRERIKDCLRPRSRARGAWLAARGLHVRGVPAAHPLALLESRHKAAGGPDFLITEALENQGTLLDYLLDHPPTDNQLHMLGERVADLLIRLAEERIYHPDTKPTNVLVQENGDGYRLHLVDLDRVEFGAPLSRGRWIKSLARLNAGLPDSISTLARMRCLRRCARGRWEAAERLEVARRVQAASLKR